MADLKNIIDDQEGLIDLNESFQALVLNKKFLLICSTFFVLLSSFYALMLPNIYTSETTFRATVESNQAFNQYNAGFSSMLGIITKSNNADLDLALATFESKKLVSRLMKKESFLPDLMAAKRWNSSNDTIEYDESLYDVNSKKWLRKVSSQFSKKPSSQEAIHYFLEAANITQDESNNTLTLKVSHISPTVARNWSEWIIGEINLIIASTKINEAEASIDYLNKKILTTPYPELKTMFYELIKESTKYVMLANIKTEYALTIIDPPLISELPSGPKHLSIIFLGFLIGFSLSILIILVRHLGFNRKDELNFLKYH
jgi:uncharacterized protein involved in exopolysaccharide biosynthesis